MLATTPDLVRLIVLPVFGWAAWRDVKTRRVPNRTWYPLAILAVGLLVVESAALLSGVDSLFGLALVHAAVATDPRLYFLRVALSVGFIIPLSTAFWSMGSFGGADAKAFYVIALLFPVYPVYYLPWAVLPFDPTPIGVFSVSILSNTVVVGVVYPLGVALGNLLRGHVGWPMLIGKPVRWDETTGEYGVVLQTPDGFTRAGLDLDALRMYLQWRGVSLPTLRDNDDSLRDPETLPADPNPPGDGGLVADGGIQTDETPDALDDPWGAQAFLDDIDHSAYGTSAEQLRAGLDVLTTTDDVWVSPGIPFLVPMFFGLLVSLTYGDVLFTLVGTIGFA